MTSINNITTGAPALPSVPPSPTLDKRSKEVKGTEPAKETKRAKKETTPLWENICTFFTNIFSPKNTELTPSSALNGAKSSISFTPKITFDPIDPMNTTRRQLEYSKELQDEQKELECLDVNWLIKESGLDRAWLKIQVDSLALRDDITRLNEQELIRLYDVIKTIAKKIEEIQKERLQKGETSRLFGKLEAISSILLLATVILVGVLTAVTGIGGIAIPLLLGNALAFATGAASIWHGGVTIGKAVNDHNLNLISAEFMENRENRSDLTKWILALNEEIQRAKEEETALRKRMREYQQNENNILRMAQYV